MTGDPQPRIGRRTAITAAVIGMAAAAVCIAAAWLDPTHFFPAYLAAALWVWSIAVGGIALGLLFHLTGGRWGEAGRPWFETAARTMPLVCLMFVPLAFGLAQLYPWAEPGYFQGLEKVGHRQWYLSPTFFRIRSVAYFGIWIVLSLLIGGVLKRHRRDSPVWGGQATAGVSAVVLLLTITWAGFDWLMSLDPWFASSLFGALFGIGAMLSGMAFVVAGAMLDIRRNSLPEPGQRKAVSDLGNLLLMMVLLWTYLSFSQYLLMWSGNLPEEAEYYADRNRGGWQFVSMTLAMGGFGIPLALLLSTRLKQSPQPLGWLGVWLVFLRLLETGWLVLPHFSPAHLRLSWLAVVAPLATGGLWLAFVAWDLPPSTSGPPATGGDRVEY